MRRLPACRDRRDAFLQGFLIVVVIALVIGLPTLVGDLAKGLRPNAIEAELDQAMSEMDKVIQQMQPFLGNMPSGEMDAIMAQVKRICASASTSPRRWRICQVPAETDQHILRASRQVGLAAVHCGRLPARRGGPGHLVGLRHLGDALREAARRTRHLAGFFGVTALFAVPHLLAFFAFIPIVGGILGLVAYFWGLAIYIKGTASSHQMSLERSSCLRCSCWCC